MLLSRNPVTCGHSLFACVLIWTSASSVYYVSYLFRARTTAGSPRPVATRVRLDMFCCGIGLCARLRKVLHSTSSSTTIRSHHGQTRSQAQRYVTTSGPSCAMRSNPYISFLRLRLPAREPRASQSPLRPRKKRASGESVQCAPRPPALHLLTVSSPPSPCLSQPRCGNGDFGR